MGHQRPLKGLFCLLSLWQGRCDVSQGNPLVLTLARDTCWELFMLGGIELQSKNGYTCTIT